MGSRVWGQLPPLAASSMSSLEGSNSIPNGFLTIHGGGGGALESGWKALGSLKTSFGTPLEHCGKLPEGSGGPSWKPGKPLGQLSGALESYWKGTPTR